MDLPPTYIEYHIEEGNYVDKKHTKILSLYEKIIDDYELMYLMEKTGFNPHKFWKHPPTTSFKQLKLFILKKATKYGLKHEIETIKKDIFNINWIYDFLIKLYKKELKYATN